MNTLLHSWVNALHDAALVVDPHSLRVLAGNAAAHTLLGTPAAPLLGRPVIELLGAPADMYFWEDVAAGHADAIHSETLVCTPAGHSVAVERKVARVWLDAQSPYYLVCLRDLSPALAQQARLEDHLADLRATLESSHDALLVTDSQGGVLHCNHRFTQLWLLPPALLGSTDHALWWRHMESLVLAAPDGPMPMLRPPNVLDGPLRGAITLRDGRTLEHRMTPKMCRGALQGVVHAYRDISEDTRQAQRLRLAAKVLDCSPDAILITAADFAVVQANPVCTQLLGVPGHVLVGRSVAELFADPGQPDYFAAVCEALQSHGSWSGELVHPHTGRPVAVVWVALLDDAGVLVHTVCFVRDLTERVQAQQRIGLLAQTDLLTGLPNRAAFTRRAELLLGLGQRQGYPCGVLFVDLDRFKHINESFGHAIGDRVLVEVAQRIRLCLREIDALARLGSDEFVVFLQEADAFGAEVAARRIMAELRRAFVVDSMDFSLGCSIGIALSPDDGATVDVLVQCAETAMQSVKERGRGFLRFYQAQKNVDSLSRIKTEHAMRQGLEQQRFHLVYQPQIALADGRLLGAEALLRWSDPDLGKVAPSTFIPLAEESGFIIPLGNWVLGEAVRQATLWQKQGMPTVVSVNVSALQFHQSDFVERVADSLRALGLWPDLLELELTESIL
ncbi:MAG: hypothetical protein QG643_1128, partial [Pseudomonadota bacterium]|nr:hypothetical protein [Pseudomonadota bacterium]